MESAYATGTRDGMISGVSEVAEELRDAEVKEEFTSSVTPDFTKKMKGVYQADKVVQTGVGLLTDAVREELVTEEVPEKTKQDASVIRGYADMAIKQRPAKFSDERQKQERMKQAAKLAKRQRQIS